MLDTLAFVGLSLELGRDEVKEVEDYCFSCYYTCLVCWAVVWFYFIVSAHIIWLEGGKGMGMGICISEVHGWECCFLSFGFFPSGGSLRMWGWDAMMG
jgi:hypothetical protein